MMIYGTVNIQLLIVIILNLLNNVFKDL